VFVINADDLRVAHLGDLGYVLTADQAAEIGTVDIVLAPVGGFYTINGKDADTVAGQIGAKIVIPMHYSSDKCRFPIASLEDYLEGKTNVRRVDGSAIEVTRDSLPSEQQVVTLKPAL
jgi:L-ascorbate metabolism protein UlaG (beta-lactamase superfamily)